MIKRKARLAAAAGLAAALVLTGCSKNEGDDDDAGAHATSDVDIISTDPEESKGPADEVKGAKEGGSLEILSMTHFSHPDPQRNYTGTSMMAMGGFVYRSLAGYREDSEGNVKVVGDLATTPGTDVNGDCTTWEYELKDGLKYEDGKDVTAEDVAYGIARSFSASLQDGPQFLADWLDPERKYKGMWDADGEKIDGAETTPPGVTVDGNKLTMEFDQPRCEVPFAAAMSTTTPVPAAEDTGLDYDKRPFSSGPYKIKENKEGSSITLERNEHWDADSDPLRHAFPDEVVYTFGEEASESTVRMEANASGDEHLVDINGIHPDSLADIMQNEADFEGRLASAPQQYTSYLAINNETVPDLNVRQAINHAFPRDRWIQAQGGTDAQLPSTTLIGPTVPGYEEYDVYPYDVDKAKELLDGEEPTIRYAHSDTPLGGQVASMLEEEYEKAGIKIEAVPIPPDNYYDQIAAPDHDYDLYRNIWGQDWPSGSTVVPPLWHSTGIDAGTNYPRLDDPEVDKKIDELLESDKPFAETGPEWNELGKWIQEEHAPVVPTDYLVGNWLVGSEVGGLQISNWISTIDTRKLYVKDA
ncbi:MAG: ABC transporter substrate-binding protein [Stackebrandtia sp.]